MACRGHRRSRSCRMRCPGSVLRWCTLMTRGGGVAELRSIILKARRLADDHAEQERAAAVVKTWLLAQIEKNDAPRRRISRIRRWTPRASPNASPPERPQPIVARRCPVGTGVRIPLPPAERVVQTSFRLTGSRDL